MKRTPYILVLLLAIAIAFVGGVTLTQRSGSRAQEKTNDDENRILVHGYGTANSAEKSPGEQFTLIASNAPHALSKLCAWQNFHSHRHGVQRARCQGEFDREFGQRKTYTGEA